MSVQPGTGQFVIGIIGGGQLARMMHQAAIALGVRVRLLAEGPDVSAAQVIHDVTVGDYTDPETVRAFADGCDVITFDHEHVPTRILRDLEAAGVAVRPGPDALVHAQDKAVMRERLGALGIPCPINRVVADPDALVTFGKEIGWPVIAKTTRGGYDGHGVWKIEGPDEAGEPFADLRDGVRILAEEYVDFARELSALVVRSPSGQAVAYPISETVQRDGICVETTTPAPGLDPEEAVAAQQLALTVAHELGVVGVLAVELMERKRPVYAMGAGPAHGEGDHGRGVRAEGDHGRGVRAEGDHGRGVRAEGDQRRGVRVEGDQRRGVQGGSSPLRKVVVNELAMRPHNTGHWSIDGAHSSQFDNHVRAVLDLPLGDPAARVPWTVMVNVLGGSVQDLTSALLHCFARDRRLRVELYGKQVRPGRKVGHVTCFGDDLDEVRKRARHAAQYLMGDEPDGRRAEGER